VGSSHVRMVFVVPGELVGAWEAAKTKAQREGLHLKPWKPTVVHNGQVLEVLIAEYLASPFYPADPDTPQGAGE
jgi:hypothetical protein